MSTELNLNSTFKSKWDNSYQEPNTQNEERDRLPAKLFSSNGVLYKFPVIPLKDSRQTDVERIQRQQKVIALSGLKEGGNLHYRKLQVESINTPGSEGSSSSSSELADSPDRKLQPSNTLGELVQLIYSIPENKRLAALQEARGVYMELSKSNVSPNEEEDFIRNAFANRNRKLQVESPNTSKSEGSSSSSSSSSELADSPDRKLQSSNDLGELVQLIYSIPENKRLAALQEARGVYMELSKSNVSPNEEEAFIRNAFANRREKHSIS